MTKPNTGSAAIDRRSAMLLMAGLAAAATLPQAARAAGGQVNI